MKEKTAATAASAKKKTAAPAPKRRVTSGAGGGRPGKRLRDDNGAGVPPGPGHGDLISDLPDAILGTIISLLPSKDGARPQVLGDLISDLPDAILGTITAPLNLEADYTLCRNEFKRVALVSKILSYHHRRRFDFCWIRLHKDKKRLAEEAAQMESWFRSRALVGLQDLEIGFDVVMHGPHNKFFPLPPSVFQCASTLVVARIIFCDFPKEIDPSVSFASLKQLTLRRVSICGDVFHDLLSACHVLVSLYLDKLEDVGCVRISSPTLRSVGICDCSSIQGELIIEDAPLLERLLLPHPGEGGDNAIRVVRAPKLETLGLLSPSIPEIQIANLVLHSLAPASLKDTISTVKILALEFSVPNLTAAIDVLRCFPCLEKLYVILRKYRKITMKNVHQYDPLDPVKCLETHLKELLVKNYEGNEQDVSFGKFFILNAKVLKEIKFAVDSNFNKDWVEDQCRLLEVGTRASPDAQLVFNCTNYEPLDAHNLSTADPFTCYFSNF